MYTHTRVHTLIDMIDLTQEVPCQTYKIEARLWPTHGTRVFLSVLDKVVHYTIVGDLEGEVPPTYYSLAQLITAPPPPPQSVKI